MDNAVLSLIRSKYNILSSAQRTVADYVLANPEAVIMSTLNDMATAADVSETTIIRFLHKLNYNSYQVFRVNIAQELSKGKADKIYDEVSEHDDISQIIKKVNQSIVLSIQDSVHIIDPAQMQSIVDALIKARRILIIGIGASAAQAYDMYHKLLKLNIQSTYCHDPHMINIQANNLTRDDVLVVFSHSGESREVLDGVRYATKNGGRVVAVTSYSRSTLATLSNNVLLSSSRETRYHSDSMISRIIQLAIIDMLYIALAIAIGEDASDSINQSRIAVAGNKT